MAQELVTIQKQGTSGIISDVSPIELPIEAITDGNNIRVTTSGVKSTGGYEELSVPPWNFNPGFLIHNHVSDSGDPVWLVAGASDIFKFGPGWTLVSSVLQPAYLDPLKWTGCNLGKLSMLSHPDHQPMYIDMSQEPRLLVPLPFDASNDWLDVDKSFKVIRTHKNFLFALNLTESGEHYPDGYRWSHPADANGYPFTWDENDLSGLASREALGGEDGAIVDGLSLRDSFVIYSEQGIDILDYTGDDQLFKRRSLSTSAGLLSKDCVVEVNGSHYLISDGDILVNDGTTISSIMFDKLRRKFINDLSTEHHGNSYAVKNDLFKEVWFCIPTEGSEYPNVAYTYSWITGAWGRRELPANTPFAAQGAVSLPKVTWATAVGSWGDQVRTWGARKISPENETILGCRITDAALNILEASDANSVNYQAFVERVGIPLGGNRQHTTINAIYPHMTGSAEVNIQVGSQDHTGGPIRWGVPVKYIPSQDRKVNVRSSGALHCYRVSSEGKAPWGLTGMDIEYSIRGLR